MASSAPNKSSRWNIFPIKSIGKWALTGATVDSVYLMYPIDKKNGYKVDYAVTENAKANRRDYSAQRGGPNESPPRGGPDAGTGQHKLSSSGPSI